MIKHPEHYGGKDDPYEAIKVIEAWDLCFHLGNVLKYIKRRDRKGDELQNLEKAAFYINRKIENLIDERKVRKTSIIKKHPTG
ncbi:MAG TPA: DUF3310 domain-containing protein [Tissierellaceae bacterium]|nr:DUF3310 domain-containing protein [Tissierellaceae bacterium]